MKNEAAENKYGIKTVKVDNKIMNLNCSTNDFEKFIDIKTDNKILEMTMPKIGAPLLF